MEKTFKGKAIYNPSGKAGEYSYWACNFYKGCSNGCTYCYLKTGVLAHALGGDKPELKACFKDKENALVVFQIELFANIDELRKHGLFFSFTTDPLLPQTIHLTVRAIDICMANNVPVKILTKRADWLEGYRTGNDYIPFPSFIKDEYKSQIAFGFTLTGHDELEPNASTNAERIEAMRKLHEAGFKTFASIEPIIDFESSRKMIQQTTHFCNLYKIGLESGKKYKIEDIHLFLHQVSIMTRAWQNKLYFKDSILTAAKIKREQLHPDNCVNRDYNIFK
jgi:DNA repair photolyase